MLIIGEAHPVDALHDDEVDAAVSRERVHRHEARMPERGERTRFVGERWRVGTRERDLDRDFPAERVVVGLEDLPHAALTEHAHDLIAATHQLADDDERGRLVRIERLRRQVE